MIKVDSNRKLHFDGEWMCTDPDTHQFCQVVDEHTFIYIQLKETSPFHKNAVHSKNLLKELDGQTTYVDWYVEEIDVNHWSDEDINEALEPYGGILDGVKDEQSIKQLIAECIFEQYFIYD